MNTLKISNASPLLARYGGYLLLIALLLILPLAQRAITLNDPAIGFIDPNIWLLLLMGFISFMMVIGLCWWLLQGFWMSIGLPGIGGMVSQFKELSAWQQLGFYWASFVCLLWAAVGVIIAIV